MSVVVLPVRQMAGLVSATLRSDRSPVRLPQSLETRAARSLMGLRRRAAKLRLGRVETDGFAIPYLTGGTAHAGRDVVCIHGFSDTKDSFVDVAGLLGRNHRVFLPDVPGFSDASQPWEFHYSLPAITEVLAGAFDKLGLARFHVVGNSLGGAIAAQYALTHPDRVRTLTLIGAAGVEMPVASDLKRLMDDGINPFVLQTYEQWSDFIEMVLEKPPPMPEVVRRYMARVFIGRAALNSKIMDDLLEADFDLTERLPEIGAPTLALYGKLDRLIHPSCGRVYHEGIDRSRLVYLHGIGHCPQVEVPSVTARLVRELFDEQKM